MATRMGGALYGPQVKYGSTDAQRQQLIAQQLLNAGASTAPVQGGWAEALGRIGTAGIGGYLSNQAGETEKAYQSEKAKTLAQALLAGQDQPAPAAPTLAGGEAAATRGMGVAQQGTKGDPMKVAQMLMANPSTADMGAQLALGQMQFNQQRAATKEDRADERQYQTGVRQEQRSYQVADMAAQQNFQKEIARTNQAFQSGQLNAQQAFAAKQAAEARAFQEAENAKNREATAENKTPLVVPDANSPTGYTYQPPSEAMGKPATPPVPKLSATSEKELFEADDIIRNSTAALKLLDDAAKLNPQANAGFTAGAKTWVDRNVPGFDKMQAARTTDFNAIVTGQALESLRSTFGGNPTEGERKILLDIQAAPNMSVPERAALLERTKTAVANRRAAAEAKAASIRGQSFSKPQQSSISTSSVPPSAPTGMPAPPPGFTVLP